jgi:hypothetical protein
VQVGQQPPVTVHHLASEGQKEPEVVLGLAELLQVLADGVLQGLGGRLGQPGVVGGRPRPDPAGEVLELPVQGRVDGVKLGAERIG